MKRPKQDRFQCILEISLSNERNINHHPMVDPPQLQCQQCDKRKMTSSTKGTREGTQETQAEGQAGISRSRDTQTERETT